MPSLQWFYSQISQIPGPKKESGTGKVFILCPYHSEKTPSGRINLAVEKGTKYLGSFKCYGCGAKADWNELAAKLGLKTLDGRKATLSEVPNYNLSSVKQQLLGKPTEKESNSDARLWDFDFFDVRDSWRGFSAQFLNELGIKLVYNDLTGNFYLYLPVMVKKKEVGFIRASLRKKKDTPTYLNKPGTWSLRKGLFLYDQSLALMKELGLKTVVLVEGPRDALRLYRASIPAMSIIGTQSWGSHKRMLIEKGGVERVILLMDGDLPGKKAGIALAKDLTGYFEVKHFKLWKYAKRQGLDKVDPCSMPRSLLKVVRTRII